MERGYYMVRAMFSRKEDLEVFFKNNVVAIGWSEVNLAALNDTSIREKVKQSYYSGGSVAPQVVGKNLNEVIRFKNIEAGDYVIVPYWDTIALAEAKAEEYYSESDCSRDMANQRKVEYQCDDLNVVKRIPRKHLSERLQRRLRVPGMTVIDLADFAEEIENLYREKVFSDIDDTSYIEKFKTQILKNIQTGNTNLKAGGDGLEELVVELCQCEGYEAKKLTKKAFKGSGDADVEIIRSDRFNEMKALIQVKHHGGETDITGINQLEEIMKDEGYSEYSFILVTSGTSLELEAMEKAKKLGIEVITGDGLAEWIFDCHEKLKPETKKMLRILSIPQFAD
jgi:Restriction endonuclease.